VRNQKKSKMIYHIVLAGLVLDFFTQAPAHEGIGKIQKSRFMPVYSDRGDVELGWKAKTNIRFAQGKPGVYLIKKNGVLIYIGASDNDVYRKCLRHFEPYEARESDKHRYGDDYDENRYTVRIVLTNDGMQAYRLECALINKYTPVDNKIIPECGVYDKKALNAYEESEICPF
jgi:Uri superfamily endonuclease